MAAQKLALSVRERRTLEQTAAAVIASTIVMAGIRHEVLNEELAHLVSALREYYKQGRPS